MQERAYLRGREFRRLGEVEKTSHGVMRKGIRQILQGICQLIRLLLLHKPA